MHRDVSAENLRRPVLRPLHGLLCLLLAMAVFMYGHQATGQDALPQPEPQPQEQTPSGQQSPPQPHTAIIIPLTDGMVIDMVAADLVKRGVALAKQIDNAIVIVKLDTPGGLVVAAVEIVNTLHEAHRDGIKTVAWVAPEAISAGAMIAVACSEILVDPQARFGDCAPIAMGQNLGETERAKIDSYVLSVFRSSAQLHGYPMTLCESMVRIGYPVYEIEHRETGERAYVFEDELYEYNLVPPNVTVEQEQEVEPSQWKINDRILRDSELLTMDAEQSVRFGFASRLVTSQQDVFNHLNVVDSQSIQPTAMDRLASWLTSPFVRSILTLMLFIGLYAELQSPGVGFPGAAALIAFILLIGAPYLTGLAATWEIGMIILGIALIALEIFVIPGFGIAGFLGLAFLFSGLVLIAVPEDPEGDFLPVLSATWSALWRSTLTVLLSIIMSMIAIAFLSRYYQSIPLFNKLVLQDESHDAIAQAPGVNFNVASALDVGAKGQVLSMLRPVGRAEFDGAVFDVVSRGEMIPVNQTVRVIEVRGNRIVVEEA